MANAMRLTFVHKAGQVQLQSRTSVDARIPAGQPGGDHGFWVELRDSNDNPLHKQIIHNPIPPDREVFSPDPSRSVERAPGGRAEDVFSVLVPDLPGAQSLALVSSHHEAVHGLAAAVAPSVNVAIKRLDPGVPPVARTIARFQLH